MTLIINIKVIPLAAKNCWIVDKTGILKLYLTSPPQNGLANKEIIKTISKMLRIPMQNIAIISGLAHRNKRIKINKNIHLEEFLKAAGIEQQMKLFN